MASGRPDWYSSVAIHGKYGDDYITVNVDELGNMLAKMQGLFGADLKTIAVDTDGIMKANLAVQDINVLRVNPSYGRAYRIGSSTMVDSGDNIELVTTSGRGIVYGGFWYWGDAASARTAIPMLYIDGDAITISEAYALNTRELTLPGSYPIFLTHYDDTSFRYNVALSMGITFDTALSLHFYHNQGYAIQVTWEMIWAITG